MDITDFMPDGFQLRKGAGGGDPKNGLCYMETVALIAGESISDTPKCACPIITCYGIRLNDSFDDEARQRLLPLAWATAGTRSKEREQVRLEILGRAACDIAEIVLPVFEAKHPNDKRPANAIKGARAYWDNPTAENKKAAYAAADIAYAAAAAADAADTAAAAAADTAAAAAAADTAYAYAYATAYATAAPNLKQKIQERAIKALRDAIEAGPNGGIPTEQVAARIDAVKPVLAVSQ